MDEWTDGWLRGSEPPTGEGDSLASRTAGTDLASLLADALRAQVGDSRYELWFEGNASVSLDRDGVTIAVPNRHFREWFEAQFGKEVAAAAAKALGRKMPIRFAIKDAETSKSDPSKNSTPSHSGARPRPVTRSKAEFPSTKQVSNAPPRKPCRYALQTFVVGSPNRVAHAAAAALVEHPGHSASPLYFYGGIGVGKTHLLRGIEDGLQRANLKVACYNCEEFANEFIEAYRGGKLPAFRRRVRSLDVLMVDDVHFLAGKRATQEELFHAMEAIQHRGGKVILTGDAHPRRLAKIGEDLRSRFMAGMAAKLESPTREMRRQLVSIKAAERGLGLSDDVVHFIADQIRAGVREIEGATTYLAHAMKRGDDRLTVSDARTLLADLLRHADAALELPVALAKALEVFRITKARLQDRSRTKAVSEPRALIIYLLRRFTGAAYSEIGRVIGGFNHSTVLTAEKRLREKLLKDGAVLVGDRRWKLQDAVDAFEREVGRPE